MLVFMDSGAHGLYTEHVIKKKHSEGYSWYESKDFWKYVDSYGAFIKQNQDRLRVYANVDVIFNPELTWKVQRYLEKEWGLTPIPVIHYGTSLDWLSRYLSRGHDYVALGGLGQEVTRSAYVKWADKAFDLICDKETKLPKVKVHGFAVTSFLLMRRYPWYSVDSSSWLKHAIFGQVLMPKFRCGTWDYGCSPLVVRVSKRKQIASLGSSSTGPVVNIHTTPSKMLRDLFFKYISERGFVLGDSKVRTEEGKEVEEKVEDGLCNNYDLRCKLNALFYLDFVSSLPEWPWPFESAVNAGFGLL